MKTADLSLWIVLGGLCLVFGLANPVFISPGNIVNVLNQVSILAIISFGLTVVILIGGIDLSVGSIVALCGIVLAKCLLGGISLTLSIVICVFVGAGIGFLNGIIIAFGKVPAFIATLGVMSSARGLALLISDGRAVSSFDGRINVISNFELFFIPFPVILFAVFFCLTLIFIRYTYWGHFILAIGGSEKAAWLSGINIKKYKVLVYMISGITSAVGSVILVSKLNSAQPQAGLMYELDAIAATVIGGASLAGGKASITGTLAGALILGVVQNGLSILNVQSYYQQIMIGLIIVFAVLVDNNSIKFIKNEK